MEALLQDIRHAFRRIRKKTAFAAIALLTLGLGIGANTAISSLADLIIRRPVDLPGMDSLVVVDEQLSGSEGRGISPANYLDLRLAATSFKQLSAYAYWSASENTQGQPHELQGVRVSANFFPTIGVSPILGRVFAGEDTSSVEEGQIVISNALWEERFSSAASAEGQTLTLDGKPYTVIGVMPSRATFPLGAPAFWIPLTMSSGMRSERSDLTLRTVGRLRAGVSVAQARSEVDAIWKRLKLHSDANRDRTIETTSLHDSIVLDYNRQFAHLLMGVVGMVLLIACTNCRRFSSLEQSGADPKSPCVPRWERAVTLYFANSSWKTYFWPLRAVLSESCLRFMEWLFCAALYPATCDGFAMWTACG